MGAGNVSRIWHQWIDGNKVEWPADELPHPRTVFKTNFINQFIGWYKYLTEFSYNYKATEIQFIEPGTIIQPADFWNSLHGWIFGYWSESWPMGWIYTPDPDSWFIEGTYIKRDALYDPIPIYFEYITEIYKTLGYNISAVQRGDNLQAILREFFYRLRNQMDRCVIHQYAPADFTGVVQQWRYSEFYDRWDRYSDYVGTASWIHRDTTGNIAFDCVVDVAGSFTGYPVYRVGINTYYVIRQPDADRAALAPLGIPVTEENEVYIVKISSGESIYMSGPFPCAPTTGVPVGTDLRSGLDMYAQPFDILPGAYQPPEY